MNRYESYKPSDIDWIGEIPSHWETVQPKYKLNRVTRPIDDEDEVITCFRDGVVTLRKNRREDGFTNSVKEHGYQQIHPGDLVVHEMDGFAGAIGISDSKGKSTPVYTVVEPDDRTDLKYIAYLLREMSQTGKIESLARSIRERTTDFRWNMWSVINFPFPPIEEQKLISRYLDKKTSQIDSLVEKIQKKIELLKEQRTSLINHYVTKGLDPNVEMKDSGVEWIGEIPKHWNFLPIKRILEDSKESMRTGPFGSELKSSDFVSSGYRVYNQRTVYDHEYFQNDIFIDEDKFKKLNSFQVKKGDLLVTTRGTIGKLSIVPEGVEPGVIHPCLIRFRTNDELIEKKYLVNYFNESSMFITNVLFESNSTTIEVIYSETLRNIHLPIPPLEEQRLILEFLSEKLDRTDCLIQKENHRISVLKEYRQSLISSVVTGKVRVTEDMI